MNPTKGHQREKLSKKNDGIGASGIEDICAVMSQGSRCISLSIKQRRVVGCRHMSLPMHKANIMCTREDNA